MRFSVNLDLPPHNLQPFLMMAEELVYPAIKVAEEQAVPWEDEVRRETLKTLEALQVAGERARRGLRPVANVRRDPEQDVVPGQEDLASLAT